MKCKECGKELTEEGRTICDECQEKLLQKISEEENVVSEEENNKKLKKKDESTKKSKEKKDSKEKNKKESKNESKKESKDKENKSEEKFTVSKEKAKKPVLKIVILTILVLAIAVAGVMIAINLDLIHFEKVGATIGNIRNYGYATYQGNKIYYIAPNADSTKIGIYSADITGENVKELFMNEEDVMSLNAYGNYLYFITISESTEEYGEYDNKICKMKNDGTDLQVINDNEFNDYGYEIYVVKNKIYYIGEDSNIYKMNLDGSNRELVSDKGTGYIGITDKYIIYNDYADNSSETSEESSAYEYKTCIMNLDGSDARSILGESRLYTVNVYDDVIYYTNENLELYRVNVDGTDNKKLLDGEVYNLNVAGGYIFYLGYRDIENDDNTICVFRADLDGSNHKIIKELTTGTNYINVLDNKILFMDTDLQGAYIKLANSEGEDEKNLYTLSLEDLYSQIEGTEIEEEITDETDVETEITNETTANNTTNTVETNSVATNTVVNNTAETNSVATNTAVNNTAEANLVTTNSVVNNTVEANLVATNNVSNTTSSNTAN